MLCYAIKNRKVINVIINLKNFKNSYSNSNIAAISKEIDR